MIMNQIINIDFNKNVEQSENTTNKINTTPSRKKLSKKTFNIQFFLSITAILVISSIFVYYKFSLNSKENFSDLLINNYSITQLRDKWYK